MIDGMFYKTEIKERVYNLYLNGVDVVYIAYELDMTINEINSLIDYINEVYF